MTHGWRSRIINYSRQSRARPLSKKTHISQTHSVTSCRSSVVRLNKYAAFDVCCVIFSFFIFFCISTAGKFLHLFSTSRLYPLLVAQCLFGIERCVKRSTRHCPARKEFRSSPTEPHSLHTDVAEIGAQRLAAAVPSARHAARATTNLSAPHLSPAKQITICA